MERPTVQLDKNSQERRAARTKILLILLLVGLAVLAGLIAFFRHPSFQVSDVSVQGAKSIDSELVSSEAKKFLKGTYVVVVPRSNVLLISKRNMESFIREQVPSLASVRASFLNRTSLVLTIVEKKPDFVWCSAESACYFVDRAGIVFSDAPVFSDGVYVTLRGGTVAADRPVGSSFTTSGSFENLQETLRLLKFESVEVLGVEFRDNGDSAYRIGSIAGKRTGTDSLILSVQDMEPDALIQSLGLILSDRAFDENLSTKGALLEYLDLRFPGKIYYKFRE